MTLLEAPEPASRLPSNSLFADSVARLVSAATVEAMLAVELAVELDVLLALAAVPGVGAIRLLVTLPIDIMDSDRDCWKPAYRPGIEQLESSRENRDPAACAPQLTRARKDSSVTGLTIRESNPAFRAFA